MEYTKLGRTEIEISRVCVGCMSFGKAGTVHDWTLDESATEAVIRHALDLGINFFDTANGYSAGTSEEYLGKALRKSIARDKVVIASKVYFRNDAGQRAVVPLRFADIAQPFAIRRFHRKVEQHMLGGKRRVGRPAVFFAVRAIGGEVVEVGKVGNARRLLQAVERFAG